MDFPFPPLDDFCRFSLKAGKTFSVRHDKVMRADENAFSLIKFSLADENVHKNMRSVAESIVLHIFHENLFDFLPTKLSMKTFNELLSNLENKVLNLFTFTTQGRVSQPFYD